MHSWKRVRNGCSAFDFGCVQSISLRGVNVWWRQKKTCLFQKGRASEHEGQPEYSCLVLVPECAVEK
jgi:hypothetical protein